MPLTEVQIAARPIERFAEVLGDDAMAPLLDTAAAAEKMLAGRTMWNVNTTARGGGVAEMLQVLLAYARAAHVDTRWAVISGDPEFFAITKRLHNGFHGSAGDGGELGSAERRHYERITETAARELLAVVRPGDVVLLHDPQTAGMAPHLTGNGLHVGWRNHIACDEEDELSLRSWSFIRPYLDDLDAYVFSRDSYVPGWVAGRRVRIIAPSIDPFSAKNQHLSDAVVDSILVSTGLMSDTDSLGEPPIFERSDGSPARVGRWADILRSGPPPPLRSPLVVQVSRWDRLKDMPGVMTAFAEEVDAELNAQLLLVGPNVSSVADDPEGADVLTECQSMWRSLPQSARSRIGIACLPMADLEENAAIVNALQRHATVVVQKSLAEGFGLTVAEAMWKARPVVATSVGGIADQIVDGESGLLIDDPYDLAAVGGAISSVLADPSLATELGTGARERVRAQFLSNRHLLQYAELLTEMISDQR